MFPLYQTSLIYCRASPSYNVPTVLLVPSTSHVPSVLPCTQHLRCLEVCHFRHVSLLPPEVFITSAFYHVSRMSEKLGVFLVPGLFQVSPLYQVSSFTSFITYSRRLVRAGFSGTELFLCILGISTVLFFVLGLSHRASLVLGVFFVPDTLPCTGRYLVLEVYVACILVHSSCTGFFTLAVTICVCFTVMRHKTEWQQSGSVVLGASWWCPHTRRSRSCQTWLFQGMILGMSEVIYMFCQGTQLYIPF